MEKSSELLKECTEKIKVSNADIVVHGTREKPYYEIKYHDLSDGQTHVGYSSYNLDFVFEWLEECFEIINQAADTIEALSAKLQVANMENGRGWIACEDRLPPQPKENPIFDGKPLELYLVSAKNTDYAFRAFWNGKFFADGFSKLQNVEAWQPLPEPYRP